MPSGAHNPRCASRCPVPTIQCEPAGVCGLRSRPDQVRRGPVMDHILANKATFKDATSVAGDAAIVSGVVLAHNRETQPFALGAIGLGILSKIASASTRAEADTRSWDNLPLYLSFAHFDVPPG